MARPTGSLRKIGHRSLVRAPLAQSHLSHYPPGGGSSCLGRAGVGALRINTPDDLRRCCPGPEMEEKKQGEGLRLIYVPQICRT